MYKHPLGEDPFPPDVERQAHTIGSKTDSIEITGLVVEMKGEAEKIREQVQNIE